MGQPMALRNVAADFVIVWEGCFGLIASGCLLPFHLVLFAKFSTVKPPAMTHFSNEKECF